MNFKDERWMGRQNLHNLFRRFHFSSWIILRVSWPQYELLLHCWSKIAHQILIKLVCSSFPPKTSSCHICATQIDFPSVGGSFEWMLWCVKLKTGNQRNILSYAPMISLENYSPGTNYIFEENVRMIVHVALHVTFISPVFFPEYCVPRGKWKNAVSMQ